MDGQFPCVIYNRQSCCSYNKFSNGCQSGNILTARHKILVRNENQRDKRQYQQKQRKTKTNISKKFHNPGQHKNGTNTQIDGSIWETQFYQNRSIKFGLLEVESHRNAEFEKETISMEERVDREIEFTYVLNEQKLCFLHKSTPYINGFCNNEKFDSICLVYAYQLFESVVSHGKYEDNM